MSNYRLKFNPLNSKVSKGFTLVELMVSISIFVVVTTLAVYNNSKFNASILLTNLSYEIGLSIRQAQFYGISVRAGSAQAFNSAYGVRFDLTSLATQKTYSLFEDVNFNGVNDGGDIVVQAFNVQKGNYIGKICLTDASNVTSTTSVSPVDISFKRPDPDSIIKYSGGIYNKANIYVISPKGDRRKIIVDKTGQISVVTDDGAVCN